MRFASGFAAVDFCGGGFAEAAIAAVCLRRMLIELKHWLCRCYCRVAYSLLGRVLDGTAQSFFIYYSGIFFYSSVCGTFAGVFSPAFVAEFA